MAEGVLISLEDNKSGEGFVDSFVDSPHNSSLNVSTDKNVATVHGQKERRFSDDFSSADSAAHSPEKTAGGSSALEDSTELLGATGGEGDTWEHFEIVPDRSDTPVDEREDEDEDDDGEETKNVKEETTKETTKETTEEATKENVNAQTQPNRKSDRQWESFDDDAVVHKRFGSEGSKTNRLIKSTEDLESSTGPLCGVDLETKQSEWTALHDTFKQGGLEEGSKFESEENLPFRRTQSMRADSHRAVRIVDALRQQRRLSNSSLDRERSRAAFSNEDELTRKLKVDREWDVFLKLSKRIPGTKTKWLPVRVTVKEGVLSIKKGALPSPRKKSNVTPAVVEDIILQHNHKMTNPVPRSYDRQTKLHQVKLQQTVVQEKRTVKRLFFVEHVTRCNTLYKLGSHDLSAIQNIIEAINESIRQLPVTRARGVAYRVNEVFVDLKESSDILMNCDGAVLDRKSLVRIYVQAFLTGAPECKMVLNDLEATLLQGKSLLTQNMTRQVRLKDLVLHPCINKEVYSASREIRFQPVDGSSFELLRCAIDPYISPPINVSCLMEYHQTQHNVKITSSFIVRKKHNLRQRPITNLIIKFPIPTSWSSLFMTETKFGQQRSISSTSSLRGSFRRKIKTRDCQIETHLGSAKYEPEHQAIMWRLGTYYNSSQPHTFSCDIMLKAGMQKPDMVNEKAEVTYTVPGTSTGITVKGFNVEGGTASPETWVKYEIQYRYEVQMFPDLSID